jgi:hypothetical protein
MIGQGAVVRPFRNPHGPARRAVRALLAVEA